MKKIRALFLIAFCATCCSAFYQPEQGRWMSREPLGEAFGPNLYTQVGNDPANRLDVNGLYAFDMHYYVAYVALRSSGMSRDDAWQIAYWSATPDIDPRHDAVKRAGGAAVWGPQSEAGNAQRLLHQLNGLKGDDIKKMRCCLKALYNNSTDPVVKGYALHALGDTYGHLKMETTVQAGANGVLHMAYTGQSLNELYLGPVGHGLDFSLEQWNFSVPDTASLRLGTAEAYITDLFSLVGGGNAQQVIAELQTRNMPGTSSEVAINNWRDYVNLHEPFPPYAKDYIPSGNRPFKSDKTTRNMTGFMFQEAFVTPLLRCLESYGVKIK